MKYDRYTVEDFVTDEYFQQWVLEPEAMSDSFWENWLVQHPEKENVIREAKKLVIALSSDENVLSQNDFNRMWQHIIEHRDRPATRPVILFPKKKTALVMKVAATVAAVALVAVGVYRLARLSPQSTLTTVDESQVTLQLQDGTIKVLNDEERGVITTTDGKNIGKQIQKMLDYRVQENEGESTVLEFNQLTVPYGKKFELVLSDGSHVFLNSGTTLRYPVSFVADKPRDVFLDGEAYFMVTKDEVNPFTVVTDQLNTRAYGTKFNVSSYKNENNTSTVLVEGSVGIYQANNAAGSRPVMLVPGERGVYLNGDIRVQEVNVVKYIAWTEGKLYFVNDRFDLILKEMERHFNVAVDNQYAALSHKKFTGTFDVESLDQILHVFQSYAPFKYQQQNNTITIQSR